MSKIHPAVAIQKIRKMHVQTELDEEVKRQLYRLFEVDCEGLPTANPMRFSAGNETRGIMLIEAPGGGKSTAIRTVLANASFLKPDEDTECPRYLEIQVPSPATLKSVGMAILSATGMTGISANTKEWQVWDLVRRRLGILNVSVLWLDEAQDLIDARTIKETENTLRMIKTLMQGDNSVVLILSGTERLSRLTDLDPQVSRRFTKILPSDLKLGCDEPNVRQLVSAYCDVAGLTFEYQSELCSRLMFGSRLRFGRMIETVINAIECALFDSSAALRIGHFAEAWTMQEGCAPSKNVFLSPDWAEIEIDQDAQDYEDAKNTRSVKKLGVAV